MKCSLILEVIHMKKVFCLILVMLALTGVVLAEGTDEAIAWLNPNETVQIDLTGDGVQESLFWYTSALNEYDEQVNVVVQTPNSQLQWEMPMYCAQVCAVDLDGDGLMEIFVSGDMMSDDYVTYCLQYDGDGMCQLNFEDGNRGDNDGGFYDSGYGKLVRIGNNIIELCGSQDILGTYMASRVLSLRDGRFEFVDDGVWRIDVNPERFEWEYAHLLPVQDIPVTFFEEEGEVDGILRAGEKVLISGGDKIAVAYFVTEDGRFGYFLIAPDTVNGWGSLINGIPEYELFEYIPYAD